MGEGRTYGGEYGDMGATIAAIVLDREARSTVLDADPAAGTLREPLVKVIHALRALEFKPKKAWGGPTDIPLALTKLADTIGMQAHESETVFNFYTPEYGPQGPIGQSGLVSPEAQLANGPYMIGLLNGADPQMAARMRAMTRSDAPPLCVCARVRQASPLSSTMASPRAKRALASRQAATLRADASSTKAGCATLETSPTRMASSERRI